MVTDLLFEIEFDKFHFEEIHNNPPKGIFKPPKKRRENYSGINLSSNNSVNCNSCFDDELDDLLAKREPDFYDFILSYYSYIISQLLILVVAFTATNTIPNFAFSELPEYPGTFPRQTQDLSQTSQQTETLLPTTRP